MPNPSTALRINSVKHLCGGVLGEPVHDERLGDRAGDGQQRVEARRRVLEDEPEALLGLAGTTLLDPDISVPSTRNEPSVTFVRPAMARPIVDFPPPLSPTSPTISPGRIVKLTSSTAGKAGRRNRPGHDPSSRPRRPELIRIRSAVRRAGVLEIWRRGTAASNGLVYWSFGAENSVLTGAV